MVDPLFYLCVTVSRNYIGFEASQQITELLQKQTLTTLDLSHCHINFRGANLIMRTLISSTSLRTLNLAGNNLDRRCSPEAASMIQTNTSLTDLDLSFNSFDVT